jgi:hypothetical protein
VKLTKILPVLYAVWLVLNILAYNAIVARAPRFDATCETYQNGVKINSRPCSKTEYNLSRLIMGEVVVLGLVALIVYRPSRRPIKPITPARSANLSLILSLIAIPSIILVWSGFIIGLLSILSGLAVFRSIPSPDQPTPRGAKIKAVIGIVLSLLTLIFISIWFLELMGMGGIARIGPSIKLIPLPKF